MKRTRGHKTANRMRSKITNRKPDFKSKKIGKGKGTILTPLFLPQLTPKQKLFIAYYLKMKNATQAYLKVAPHVKHSSAMTEGYRLLCNPQVRKIIEEGLAQEFKKVALSKNVFLERLKQFGFEGQRDKVAVDSLDMLGRSMGYFTNEPEAPTLEELNSEKYEFIRPKKKGDDGKA